MNELDLLVSDAFTVAKWFEQHSGQDKPLPLKLVRIAVSRNDVIRELNSYNMVFKRGTRRNMTRAFKERGDIKYVWGGEQNFKSHGMWAPLRSVWVNEENV